MDSYGIQVFNGLGISVFDSSIQAPRLVLSGILTMSSGSGNVTIAIPGFTDSGEWGVFCEAIILAGIIGISVSILSSPGSVTFINPYNYPARYSPLTISKTSYKYAIFKVS